MRIGKFQVVHSISYLQMVDSDAFIEFAVRGEIIKFRIRFTTDEELEEKPNRQIHAGPDPENEDGGLLTFKNWQENSTSSSRKPMIVVRIGEGEIPDTDVFMLAFVQYANRNYSVNLQFMLEIE